MIRAAAEAARSGSIIVLPRPPVNLFFPVRRRRFSSGPLFLHTFRTLRLYRPAQQAILYSRKVEGYSMKYAFTHGKLLAANEGISVPGGHMAGSVAVAAHSILEALAQLDAAEAQGVDLIKLMITGGVMDAKEKRRPGRNEDAAGDDQGRLRPGTRRGIPRCGPRRVAAGRARGAGKRRGFDRARRKAGRGRSCACSKIPARFSARRSRLPCPTRCLTVPSPPRLRSSSTTARSSLRASSTARRPRLPTTFRRARQRRRLPVDHPV